MMMARLTSKPARYQLGLILLLALVWGWECATVSAFAAEKKQYKDIYLSENRVCRSCTWQWTEKKQVMLINRAGQATLVNPKEILGMDTHPIVRKLLIKSLHGVNEAGPVIVPAAFDNANEIWCNNCDYLGR